ncbi:MAG: GntR family transcriptional regulator [Candidatus Cloacimonadota bacterium]|nr:GntR family transcriptional regulator [Candidatus Cloacimonadota bacterium]
MVKFNDSKPIYLQLREMIEKSILTNGIAENEIVPSNRTIAKDFKLNPQTVSRAMKELINDGYLYKKRGIGLFVKKGAKEKLRNKKIANFREEKIYSFFLEAKQIGISKKELIENIKKIY